MEIPIFFSNKHIVYLSKEDFLDKNLLQYFIDNNYKILQLNGENLINESLLIKSIYQEIGVPNNFGLNWNALWDTLTDREFWFTKPTVIIIGNYKKILSHENDREKEIFKGMLTEIPQDKLPFLVIYLD